MPLIGDFVDSRWSDAREELRKLDPDFVRRVEETVRLQHLGLEALDFEPSPRARLPTEWHRLLEDCDELVRKASILQTVTDCLMGDSDGDMSTADLGKRFFYHMQSWFIHATALAEYTQSVISNTAMLYIANADSKADKQMARRHRTSVYNQVTKIVERERNKFVHATGKSSSTTLTGDSLWEGSVAAGLTAHKSHDEFIFPAMGKRVKSGQYHRLLTELNRIIFEQLGRILRELEEDIARHNVLEE